MLDALTHGFVLVFVGLFVLAVAHKVRVLRAGQAVYEPVITSYPLLHAHAAVWLAVDVALEGIAIGLLLVAPLAGVAWTIALIGSYTVILRRLPASQTCRCFGAMLPQGRVEAIRRNLILMFCGLGALAAFAAGDVGNAPLSQGGVGVALLAAAALLAQSALTKYGLHPPEGQGASL